MVGMVLAPLVHNAFAGCTYLPQITLRNHYFIAYLAYRVANLSRLLRRLHVSP